MKVYRVGHNLQVSPYPRSIKDAYTLLDHHTTVLLSLCHKPAPSEVEEVVPHTFHWPIPDSPRPDLVELMKIVEYVESLLTAGHVVTINCHEGRNRAPVIAAVVEARRQKWTGEQALAHIRAVLPKSIYNPAFEQFILAREY